MKVKPASGIFSTKVSSKPQSAEKLFVNGHIITMDDENPVVEAMAVKGEILLGVLGIWGDCKEWV
jgi:hypothetical protein